ncbi:TNFAIP3-interacting protein 2, partial [Galemys pyrenaicus]
AGGAGCGPEGERVHHSAGQSRPPARSPARGSGSRGLLGPGPSLLGLGTRRRACGRPTVLGWALRPREAPAEIRRLAGKLEEQERETQRLLSRPQREREEEVLLLRRSVAEKERARTASAVLCRSLADETHRLRRTLAATAHMCQHLASCPGEQQRAHVDAGGGSPEVGPERPWSVAVGPPEHTGEATSVQVVEKLREENRLLRQQVARAEDLNAKWQHYDGSRDEDVRGLQAPSPPELLRKEIARLNRQLAEEMSGHRTARLALEAARRARDAALERVQVLEQQAGGAGGGQCGLGSGGVGRAALSRSQSGVVTAARVQILAYKDDFTSERADRERAQSRIHELEETVASLRRQASLRQVARPAPPAPRVRGPLREGRRSPTRAEPDASAPAVSAGQRPGTAPCPESPGEGGHPGAPQRGQGDLQCPHCLRGSGDDQGEELFRHVAECCR